MSDEQTQQADDPSGPGWRDVGPDEILQTGDMFWVADRWQATQHDGATSSVYGNGYRRRIEQPQPSDSEPGIVEDLRLRLAECEVLLAEAERGGQQVNAELQQLREQVTTLTANWDRTKTQLWDAVEARQKADRELQAERDNGMLALRSQNRLGQEALAEALQEWLRPVIELVAEHPEECSPLAVSVLGYLPGIASRLIEE